MGRRLGVKADKANRPYVFYTEGSRMVPTERMSRGCLRSRLESARQVDKRPIIQAQTMHPRTSGAAP